MYRYRREHKDIEVTTNDELFWVYVTAPGYMQVLTGEYHQMGTYKHLNRRPARIDLSLWLGHTTNGV